VIPRKTFTSPRLLTYGTSATWPSTVALRIQKNIQL
jgi:hypothetical protein